MKYSFDYLAEHNASQIGNWKGIQVYSISKKDYKKWFENYYIKNNIYYVIYDDGRCVVLDNRVIGTMDEEGCIEKLAYKKEYFQTIKHEEPAAKAAAIDLDISKIILEADTMLLECCSWRQ